MAKVEADKWYLTVVCVEIPNANAVWLLAKVATVQISHRLSLINCSSFALNAGRLANGSRPRFGMLRVSKGTNHVQVHV
jgi:hypothetical protein